ncbi:hypothetical protein BDR03DRAFT_938754 [Suillus americanus]|nr:hypothetical protein BDR03DRAFT_938754 [Suillus americanus]
MPHITLRFSAFRPLLHLILLLFCTTASLLHTSIMLYNRELDTTHGRTFGLMERARTARETQGQTSIAGGCSSIYGGPTTTLRARTPAIFKLIPSISLDSSEVPLAGQERRHGSWQAAPCPWLWIFLTT